MADLLLLKESRAIMREMNLSENTTGLFCPVMRVLKMRHTDLNVAQAKRVLRGVIEK